MSLLLKLRLVEDTEFLPQVASVDELKASAVSCCCQIQSASSSAAEGFSFQVVSELDNIPEIYSAQYTGRPVFMFRVIDAFHLPQYGLVITQNGEMLRVPGAQALVSMPLAHIDGVNSAGYIELQEEDAWGAVAILVPFGGRINYGHFLLDALPSVEYFFMHGIEQSHAFVAPQLKFWQRVHIQAMGCAPIELQLKAHRFSEVLYTSCMDYFLHSPTDIYKSLLRRQLRGFPSLTYSLARRKIYLARPEEGRKLLSDPALRRTLESSGFAAVEPSTMRVDEQIQLFQEASIIVAPTGAGLANILYCRPGTIIVEIVPPRMESLWVRHIAYHIGLQVVTYLCTSVRLNPDNPLSDHDYDVDVDRLMAVVTSLSPQSGTDSDQILERG